MRKNAASVEKRQCCVVGINWELLAQNLLSRICQQKNNGSPFYPVTFKGKKFQDSITVIEDGIFLQKQRVPFSFPSPKKRRPTCMAIWPEYKTPFHKTDDDY